MRQIDQLAINQWKIPEVLLMGTAGRKVSEKIQEYYPSAKNIAICSGAGNNGGDGLMVAYQLKQWGYNVDLYLLAAPEKFGQTAKTYYDICITDGIKPIILPDFVNSSEIFNPLKYDLIVDSLFGTGFKGLPSGLYADIIEKINTKNGSGVISIDMPSGLESDGAAPYGDVVKAERTLTIGLPKLSLVTMPGKNYAGTVDVLDIGFPDSLYNNAEIKAELIDSVYISEIFNLDPDPDSHKGTNGRLVVVGGLAGYEGAALMAARGALECGVGFITLLTEPSARDNIAGNLPELITRDFKLSDAMLRLKAETEFVSDFHREYSAFIGELSRQFNDYPADVILLGPGLGRTNLSRLMFYATLDYAAHKEIRLVIDADALFILHEALDSGYKFKNECVLTPHLAEGARLLSKEVEVVSNNRIASVKEISEKYESAVILKGPATLIAYNDDLRINTTGNPILASGGSGDVLAGMLSAFLLDKKYSLLEASVLSVYFHGLAADLMLTDYNVRAGMATRLADYISKAMNARLNGSK